MKTYKCLILCCILTFAFSLPGQRTASAANLKLNSAQRSKFPITGRVTDESGRPIPGVSVLVKGSRTGTLTSNTGSFTLEISAEQSNVTLVFSSIGFQILETLLNDRTAINVVLVQENQRLNEVIVLGYGNSKRREVVGSIAKIKGSDIAKVPTTSFVDAIQGQASGLMVNSLSGHPGAAPDIKIRGKGSINLSSSPLFIIDGVPVLNGTGDQLAINGVKPVSPLSMINPNDIESIEVLKDAAATAIYGNRGSNGVIIVTTKSAKSGQSSLTVNYDGGISALPYGQNDIFMNNTEYWSTVDQAWANSGFTTPFDPSKPINSQFLDEKPVMTRAEALTINTDHLGALTQSAGFHQVGLSSTRGLDKGGIVFSANYRDEKGLLLNNDLKRVNGRLSYNFSPNAALDMGVNINLLYVNNKGVQTFNGKGFGGWENWPAMMPFYKLYDSSSPTGFWAANSGFNALAFADKNLIKNNTNLYRTISNAFLQWNTPIKGLHFRTEAGVDFQLNDGSYWRSIFLDANAPFNNEGAEKAVTSHVYNYNGVFNYSRSIGDHQLNATAGAEATRQSSYIRQLEGSSISSSYPELINPLLLTNGDGFTSGQQYLMGMFGRLNYSYKNRYILNTSIRRDGHSVLSKDNRFATFAALGAGWIITEEKFLKLPWLSLLKLRGSYGTTGNTALSAEMTQLTMGLDPRRYGGGYLPGGTVLGPIGSPDLKWETTASTDVGFDFGLLKDRITGSVAYYNKKTSNLILRGNVPLSAGFATNAVWENIGSLRNWGWEFDVSSLNLKKNDFSWNTDFNLSFNDNKILSLNQFEKGKGAESSQTIRREGEKLDTWYLAQYVEIDRQKGIAMINQRDVNAWNNQFVTIPTGTLIPMNLANVENNKMIHSGKTALPTYFGGITNRFTYKNFDLNFLFVFSGGNWKLNSFYERGRRISDVSNIVKVDGKVWSQAGDQADFPMLSYGSAYKFDNNGNPITGTTNFEAPNTDFWLEKADFIRLRNLQLGYSLPAALAKKMRLQQLRIYTGGMNLFTITSYGGLDPETNADLTTPRTFNFGLSLTL